MQQPFSALRHSSMVKVAGIGFLILIMLIPMSMTRGVIHDRLGVSLDARRDIMHSWGGEQLIGGPVLVVPYTHTRVISFDRRDQRDAGYSERIEEEGELYLLPQRLEIDATLVPEIRRRGIHEVPVYTANTVISGVFATPDTSGLGLDDAQFDWTRAFFTLPVSDARAIRNSPSISINGEGINGKVAKFAAGSASIAGFPPQIMALAGNMLDEQGRNAPLSFSIDLDLGGSDSLNYLPFGDTTEVTVRSSWQSPSFTGAHLPETREVNAEGFLATWRVSSLGRALPSRWTSGGHENLATMNSAFGVHLFVPIGAYQLTDRATKYAVLFIGLTFVAYFLFEVLLKLKLHTLQYLLVGFANTLFYLLLLSLAEHVGFGWSYLVSAAGSTGLVAAYSSSILGSWRRASLVGAMLVGLYGFLYLTLNAENYAMLAGSIGLWMILGLVMYLTRGIDWYQWGSPGEQIAADEESTAQEELFAGKRT